MFNRDQLEEIALVLENEGGFYRQYWGGKLTRYNDTYGKRRAIIGDWLVTIRTPWAAPKILGLPCWAGGHIVEDRDQLRRYFDDRYEIPQNEINKYASIPSLLTCEPAKPTVNPRFLPLIEKVVLAGAGEWLQASNKEAYLRSVAFNHMYSLPLDVEPLINALDARCRVVNKTPIPSPEYLAEWQGTQQPQESTMSKPIEITVVTFANGADISKMTNSEVFDLIAAEEAAIDKLKQIKAQPKKLVAEITKREAGIAALVAHLDSKES